MNQDKKDMPMKMAVNKKTGKVYKHPSKEMKMNQISSYMAREKRKAFAC